MSQNGQKPIPLMKSPTKKNKTKKNFFLIAKLEELPSLLGFG